MVKWKTLTSTDDDPRPPYWRYIDHKLHKLRTEVEKRPAEARSAAVSK
jgi:hypothetical protein